jgi:hypothetical protein
MNLMHLHLGRNRRVGFETDHGYVIASRSESPNELSVVNMTPRAGVQQSRQYANAKIHGKCFPKASITANGEEERGSGTIVGRVA